MYSQFLIDEAVKELAEARTREAVAKAALDAMLDNLKSSTAWIDMENMRAEALEAMTRAEETARSEAVKAFADTGNKHPHAAITIAETTQVIYSETTAFDYCQKELPSALKLDKRAFEKYAKAVADVKPLAFVEITKEPQARIKTDLPEGGGR